MDDETTDDIYTFFGNLFAEEIEDDEDETPDVKRRRVIYVPSSDEEDQNEEQNEEPSEEEPNEEPSEEEPNEEEPNEEPSEEESVLNDSDYQFPDDCPNCWQHLLYGCECLPPLPTRSDDEIRMPFAGQWV